jgi:glycyl-tRNA synthetase beta chain
LIPDIIRKSIHQLPIAKRMRWGASTVEFVRPVHWAVLMYGTTVINTEILGLTTGNISYGHRFHAPEAITIIAPESYEAALLAQGKVIPRASSKTLTSFSGFTLIIKRCFYRRSAFFNAFIDLCTS